MIAIKSSGLVKQFGNKVALNNIDLEISRGSIHAVLGPNGAGKTTFIRVLSTLLKPTQGHVSILGHDVVKAPERIKELISLAGQSASIDEELSGYENLYLIARLLGFSSSASATRVNELLDFFSLQEARGRLVKHYSGGMRRRLDIAASIIQTPDVLFLDEPTTGLDPRSRNSLWKIVREIAQTGTTVVLTTQYLEEADQLADKITVLDEGRIVSSGTADELKASMGRNVLHIYPDNTGADYVNNTVNAINSKFPEFAGAVSKTATNVSVGVTSGAKGLEILSSLVSEGIRVKSYALSRPTLDDVFLALTGNRKETADMTSSDGVLQNGSLTVQKKEGTSVTAAHRHSHMSRVMNSLMLGWRSLLKVKHIPEQFVDVLITPAMFTFMFSFMLGGALAGSVEEYLRFLVPGMLVQTLTFNSVYTGMNIHTDIHNGIFDRLKTMPIWSPSPFFGLFVGDCLRHIISGVFLLLFSWMIGFRLETALYNVLPAMILIILFALSLSWLFVIFGMLMRSISAVMSSSWMLLMPLVFLSNIYASPETMPAWLQTFVAWNPVSWQVDMARMLFAGRYETFVIIKALASTLAFTVILAPLAVRVYRREK